MQNATGHYRATALYAIALFFLLGACHSETARSEDGSTNAVVFVCEHGSVKSLVAAVLFNKRAAERGSSIRAVARGMTPDAVVPRRIVDALRDSFDATDFRPQALSKHDIEQAAMLVTIGVDPVRIDPKPSVPPTQWNDVPDSASYTLMHQSLLRHVDEVLPVAEISWRQLHGVDGRPTPRSPHRWHASPSLRQRR